MKLASNHKPWRLELRVINNYLTVVVALLASYIIAAPFLPQFDWWLKHDSPIKAVVGPESNPKGDNPPVAIDPEVQGDRLIIPRLDMNTAINEGNISALRKGVWRLPHTSTPDDGGNTVLVGHRFTYGGRSIFYHLDKVRVGDSINIRWNDQNYRYLISEIKVVEPTNGEVEAPTDEPVLTLYTCTPLWTAKDRLVVVAKPVEEPE